MPVTADKIIVTNQSALAQKYGAGKNEIDAAIQRLIDADDKKNIKTILVDLSDAADMARFGGSPVTAVSNQTQTKRAIDAVYRGVTEAPDYLMLLGSQDVICHQDLDNPLDDGDAVVPSDLPYASDHAASTNIEDFLNPQRVVGRLPDLTGGTDPKYLVKLLSVAANYKTLPRDDYESYLGISAAAWEGSTILSLKAIFGSAADLQLSPPSGPNWSAKLLARRSHFINCHGGQGDPQFYGEDDTGKPVAHRASLLPGKITEGTVIAAECCYGAELYDPTTIPGGRAGICNTCLEEKAYGFFGSSTIAYGPADGNGEADLICQFFLRRVLEGASLGRAALQARQDFILSTPSLDADDLKTVAQFSLMGDPAIHAVIPAPSGNSFAPTGVKAVNSRPKAVAAAARAPRRRRLQRLGKALVQIVRVPKPVETTRSRNVKAVLSKVLEKAGAEHHSTASFVMTSPPPPGAKVARTPRDASRSHIVVGKIETAEQLPRKKQRPTQYVVVVAREEADGLLLRTLYSR